MVQEKGSSIITNSLSLRETPPPCSSAEGTRRLRSSHLRTHRLIALNQVKFPS